MNVEIVEVSRAEASQAEVADELMRRFDTDEIDVVVSLASGSFVGAKTDAEALLRVAAADGGNLRAWSPSGHSELPPIGLLLVALIANYPEGDLQIDPDPLLVLQDTRAWILESAEENPAGAKGAADGIYGSQSALARRFAVPTGDEPPSRIRDISETPFPKLFPFLFPLVMTEARFFGGSADMNIDAEFNGQEIHASGQARRGEPGADDRARLLGMLREDLGLERIVVVTRPRDARVWKRAIDEFSGP